MGRYTGRTFRMVFLCVLSVFLFVLELAIGTIGNSLSLSSDAFAVFSQLLSTIIGLFGVRATNVRQHRKSTYGFLRADVVGAFGNTVFAMALMFSILIEAIKRYITPQKTENALLVLYAGVIGLAFNIFNYIIFLDCCYCKKRRSQEEIETGRISSWRSSERPGNRRKISKDTASMCGGKQLPNDSPTQSQIGQIPQISVGWQI